MADNCTLKFSRDIKEHWEAWGHEVRYEIGASEILAQWADVYYIDWWDNNIAYLFNWYKENPNTNRPKFIVRAIDWDIWVRGIRSQAMVDFVDTIVCIAPHMEAWLRKEKDDTTGQLIEWGDKLKLIRPGVNLEKFPLKTKQTDGYTIGMVLGDMWWYKNHMGGLDIFATLAQKDPRWKLYIRGQHEPGQYNPVMFDHYLESRGIKDRVTLVGPLDDMNTFYEDIDILLHPGMKEAYCYAVAEAMAKGIVAFVNNFYGSEAIWDYPNLYETHEQAVSGIKEIVPSLDRLKLSRRQLIEDWHNMKTMLTQLDALL